MSDEPQTDALMVFNGINGTTGTYDLRPMTPAQLVAMVRGKPLSENVDELQAKQMRSTGAFYAPMPGIHEKRLDQTGWGVIFPHDIDPAIKEALKPLIDLRREQAGDYFYQLDGDNSFNAEIHKSKSDYLEHFKIGPGPANPKKLAYYLLLVGNAEKIPYHVQSQLDIQYAVGRLDLETPEEYYNYAQSVVDAYKKSPPRARTVRLFGVQNPDDLATATSTQFLIAPLAATLRSENPHWDVQTSPANEATKERLAHYLGGDQTPDLLFTVSHGMVFDRNDPRQRMHQGALLCSDWPGPRAWKNKPIPQDFYFGADDLNSTCNLAGMIAFHFACYSGGTPRESEFAKYEGTDTPVVIADRPFSARLPQRMLSHSNGGALAVVAHIERAWGYSFTWGRDPVTGLKNTQTDVFASAFRLLMDGYPIGAALEYFNLRYAELSSDLVLMLQQLDAHRSIPDWRIVTAWTANNDARNYVILGDPAVNLMPVSDDRKV